MKIERVQAYRITIPFVEETVVPFARHRIMHSVALRIFAGDYEGIGETTGLPGFTGESAESILAALSHLVPRVLGADPREFRRLHQQMEGVVGNPAAKTVIDIACHDLAGKAFGIPVAVLLGGLVHDRVQTQRLLPIKSVDETALQARTLAGEGFGVFEVKVVGEPDADLKRIAAIRHAVGSGVVLAVDANRAFTVSDAIRFLSALEPGNIYMEQPVNSLRQMAEVRRHSRIPIVADEAVTSLADVIQAVESGACDALSLKLIKVGGFFPATQIAAYAETMGIPFRVDDATMTRCGNTASYVFASAWKNIFACGFAQHQMLVEHGHIAPEGVEIREGWGSLKQQPGVGGAINFEATGLAVAEWKL